MRAARPTAVLAAATAALALLGGCGDATEQPAATVDGVAITQQAVVDELEAIKGNDLYVEGYGQTGGSILGTEPDTFDSAFVNQVLGLQIQYQLVLNEVADRGLQADEQCTDAARDLAISRLDGLAADGDGEPIFEAFPDGYRSTMIAREVAVLELQADLVGSPCADPDADRAYYDAHRDEFQQEQVCVSHILVETEDEAAEIKAELEAGADFAETAAARSIDPSAAGEPGTPGAGGDLGCLTESSGIVPEFLEAAFAAPIDEVTDPVQTQFGFHLLLVHSRGVPEFDDIRDEVAAALADEVQSAFGTFFQGKLDAATVVVDPRYGTWNPTTGQVDRPAADDPAEPATSIPEG